MKTGSSNSVPRESSRDSCLHEPSPGCPLAVGVVMRAVEGVWHIKGEVWGSLWEFWIGTPSMSWMECLRSGTFREGVRRRSAEEGPGEVR